MNELQKQINTLLHDDLLKDISTKTSISQLKDLIAIEKGHAFEITINRSPLPNLSKSNLT